MSLVTDSDAPPKPHRQTLVAVGWALAAAVCFGGVWAVAVVVARTFAGVDFPTAIRGGDATEFAFYFVVLGSVGGLLAGVLVGCCQSGERFSNALTLGIGGALFSAIAAGSSIFAIAAAGNQLHPFVSSSLSMAFTGLLAGLSGYGWSRLTAPPVETDEYDEDTDTPPGAKVEWLLRAPKTKRLRLSRATLRVLPVLVATAGAFAGAVVLAPAEVAFALLAVGLLGLSVGWVLYRQEQRLEALERRFNHRRQF